MRRAPSGATVAALRCHMRHGVVAVMVFVLWSSAPQAASASSGDWPQLGGGPRHAGYQEATDLSSSMVRHLELRWRTDLTPSPDAYYPHVYTAPVVAGGQVFAAPMYAGPDHGELFALDAASGSVEWSTTRVGYMSAAPAVSRGIVVVSASHPFTASAFDAVSGETLWRRRTTIGRADGENFQGAAPVLSRGLAVVSTEGRTPGGAPVGRLWAFDLATGEVLWVRLPGSRPAVAGGRVFRGTGPRLCSIALTTGEVRWRTRLARAGSEVGAPSISDGVVYVPVSGRRSHLVAVAARRGRVLWRTEVPGGLDLLAPAAVLPRRVVAETFGGRLVAFRRSDGVVAWITDITRVTSETRTCIEAACASPAATGPVIFAVADHRLGAFRASDGTRLWSERIGAPRTWGGLVSSPAITGDTVYAGSNDGYLYAYGPP